MDEKLLEVREFVGPGYSPVIDFGAWRVATLNYIDEIHPEYISFMERHNETDEVFVLSKGQAILFIGEGDATILTIHPQVLEPGKIYNVKKGVWHTVVLSEDGSVLIVENQNTRRENSSYIDLQEGQRGQIVTESKQFKPGKRS
jgi:mannose-6-phosphate isomerase-like protein (cupin superfamily)